MTNILIRCRNIQIGDTLFASSVAKKLKEENPNCVVHYDISFLQPIELMMNNPYIDGVFYKESADIQYDVVYNLIDTDFVIDPYISAVSQLQRLCNIKNFDDTFEIYTNPHLDYSIKKSIQELKNINELEDGVILVGYQVDWERKSYLFTEDEYEKAEGAEDGSGYGSGKRNIYDIINPLEVNSDVLLLALGIEEKISKHYPEINSTNKFSFTASLIKNCDYVIGAEGCITNMSSAIGTKTIITTDYIHQLFGPKGINWLKQGRDFSNLEKRTPFLGPHVYFPNNGHVHLSPYLTDYEVGEEILEIVTNGR
jgi:hypothetical protein